MSEEVKLHSIWESPFGFRVQIALSFKGIEYEYIEEDLKDKSELLLRYNPVHKKVPVLVHRGKPIPESMVIIEYVEETWPEKPILSEDLHERAMARFWAKFSDDKCSPAIFKYFSTQGEEHDKAKAELVENLKTLEGALKGNKFFGGETIGLVDIAAGWMPMWIQRIEEVLGNKVVEENSFPHLQGWFHDLLNLPFVNQNLPPPEKLREHLKNFRNSLLARST
ncbi:probable glutathione S-transferase [Nymphaea colorata]|nr:probable glutathione S-transferase [Nymphaea colorata]